VFTVGMVAGAGALYACLSLGGWLKDRDATGGAPAAGRDDGGKPTAAANRDDAGKPRDKRNQDRPEAIVKIDGDGGPRVLGEAYRDNQAAADLKYTGKTVEFSYGWPPLEAFSPEKYGEGRYALTFAGCITVRFRPSETEKLAAPDRLLKPEDKAALDRGGRLVLTVRGRCQGLSGNVVIFSDAELLSFGARQP
jgi:hypothetical protein